MSISTEILRLQTAKSDLKTAIEAKGVTVPSATTIDGYASLIGQISQGMQEAEENDVNFYDYDGFRVASFTIAEAKALTQAEYNAILPPTHDGLTFQEWNWSLSDITTYDRQYIDIGANYVPTDGKTHLFIKTNTSTYEVLMRFRGINGDFAIDWGDGSSETTQTYSSSESSVNYSHTYAQGGEYEIKISFTGTGWFKRENVTNNSQWFGADILEIRATNKFNVVDLTNLWKDCLVSIPKECDYNIVLAYSNIKQITIPRSISVEFSTYQSNIITTTKICFPKIIAGITNGYFFYQYFGSRIVLPNLTSNSLKNNTFSNMYSCKIISIPTVTLEALSNGNYINSSSIAYIDIPQGWIPTQSMNLSSSRMWAVDGLVGFFSHLGTTSTAITLTFGSTNLGKLTADQKAIATNKGYTLA